MKTMQMVKFNAANDLLRYIQSTLVPEMWLVLAECGPSDMFYITAMFGGERFFYAGIEEDEEMVDFIHKLSLSGVTVHDGHIEIFDCIQMSEIYDRCQKKK